MEFNTLTLTLHNFISVFGGGFGRLSGAVNGLLALLGGIDLVLLGFRWALGGGEQLVPVFKKLLYIGFWIWLCRSFPTISKTFVDSLVQAGFMAGGGGGGPSLIMDPSRLAGYGLDATAPLVKKVEDLGITEISDLILYSLGYLAILACYFMMAIHVFLAVLEYYLFAALVGIFMPFGLLNGTKFLAEKAIGAIVAAGVKLMVLSFIIAIIEPVISRFKFSSDDMPLNEVFAMFLTVLGLMLLCWKAPHLASSLLAGSPSLAGQDVTSPALAAAGGIVGGLVGARAAQSAGSAGSTARAAGGSTASAASSLGASVASGAAAIGSTAAKLGTAAATGGSGAALSGPAIPKANAGLVKSVTGAGTRDAPTRLIRPPAPVSAPTVAFASPVTS